VSVNVFVPLFSLRNLVLDVAFEDFMSLKALDGSFEISEWNFVSQADLIDASSWRVRFWKIILAERRFWRAWIVAGMSKCGVVANVCLALSRILRACDTRGLWWGFGVEVLFKCIVLFDLAALDFKIASESLSRVGKDSGVGWGCNRRRLMRQLLTLDWYS